jgi:hypothetical protein
MHAVGGMGANNLGKGRDREEKTGTKRKKGLDTCKARGVPTCSIYFKKLQSLEHTTSIVSIDQNDQEFTKMC